MSRWGSRWGGRWGGRWGALFAGAVETTPKYSGLGYLVDDGRKRETITLYDEEAEILELLAAIMPVIHEQQQRRMTT